jgi:hypothetical protein
MNDVYRMPTQLPLKTEKNILQDKLLRNVADILPEFFAQLFVNLAYSTSLLSTAFHQFGYFKGIFL